MTDKHAHDGDKKILAHDAVKGYRPVFYACIIISSIYLAIILAKTL